jgi:tetratricopeptide (TPR) repeat protein
VQALSGQVDAAIQNLRIAVNAAPTNVRFQLSLAEALRGVRPAEAIPHFYAAIERRRSRTVRLLAFGCAFGRAAALRRSRSRLRERSQGKPCRSLAGSGQSAHACLFGELREGAGGSADGACSQDPKNLEIWNLLGDLLRDGGQLAEAEQCGRQACALDAKSAEAHVNLATTLLIAGKYPEGFKEYEWRRQMSRAASLKHPQWDGLELNGKRILLWAEQGLGDAIQFARYVDLVRQRGGKVILGVSTLLTRLMAWMPGELECYFESG